MTEEGKLQARVKKYLEELGYYTVKNIQTSKNGWPDLTVSKIRQVPFHIECKVPGETPTPLQVYRHEEILTHTGQVTYVIHSIEELKQILCEYQLIS